MVDGREREHELQLRIVFGLEPQQRRPELDGQALDRKAIHRQAQHCEKGEHDAGEIREQHGVTQRRRAQVTREESDFQPSKIVARNGLAVAAYDEAQPQRRR